MKRLLTLWISLAQEESDYCCTSATKDIKTVLGRAEHEGLSFLTITLADFGKSFERSLDRGHVALSSFSSWKSKGGLPVFLRGFLEQVFDPSNGVLLENPSIDSIRAIRQLTLLFSKVELPCTPARDAQAFDDYIQCEKDVREADARRLPIDLEDFVRVSDLLFGKLFEQVDSDIREFEVIPRHGPGATADRLMGNEKFGQTQWTARLQEVFPTWKYLIPNDRFNDHLSEVDILEPGSEIPVEVITVPKTQKTPRIIAKEPTAMQYMQQSIRTRFYDLVRRDNLLRKMIGFEDQEPNQQLALWGSRTGTLATLDLSEASDRVSNQLVQAMVHRHPYLSQGIDATRSRRARVPGQKDPILLAKYASMGSALTFPIEAMVFLTAVFVGIERELNTTFSDRKQFHRFKSEVRVYGDDIIIPTDYVHPVVFALETFGFKVNEHKSFWTGRFRESCGREYYDGNDVSLVKCRQLLPSTRADVTEVVSLVSLRNQLYYAGLWKTVALLDDYARKVLKHYPVVAPTSSVLGRHSFLGYETQRVSEDTQAPMVKGYVVTAKEPINELDGHGALLKYFLKQSSLPAAEGHLERSGRPRAVNIKPRWTSPF